MAETIEKESKLDLSAVDTSELSEVQIMPFGIIDSIADLDKPDPKLAEAEAAKIAAEAEKAKKELETKEKENKAAETSTEEETEETIATTTETAALASTETDAAKGKTKKDPYVEFGTALAENDIIKFDTEAYTKAEDKDAYLVEAVASRIAEGIENEVTEYKNSLPEEIKFALENYEEGVKLHTLFRYEADVERYEAIKPESVKDNEILQKQVISDLLTKKGWDMEKVAAKIKRYEETGVLAEEATEALEVLVETAREEKESAIENEKAQRRTSIERANQQINALQQTINKTDELIPSMKLSKDHKKALFDGMTKRDKDGLTKIQKVYKDNPDFNLQVAMIATLYGGNFTDFLKDYEKKAVTKVSQKVRKLFDGEQAFGSTTNDNTNDKNNTKDTSTDRKVMRSALSFLKDKRRNF